MYSQFINSQSVIPKTYNCITLEGNWYEDRSTNKYNYEHKKNFSLKNPNEWRYKTTSDNIGEFNKNYPSITNKFLQSNDNYINFQKKKQEMFVSTYKHSYNSQYSDTFREIKPSKDYYLNKKDELKNYRNLWTKRDHLFDTTYKDDMIKTFLLNKK